MVSLQKNNITSSLLSIASVYIIVVVAILVSAEEYDSHQRVAARLSQQQQVICLSKALYNATAISYIFI